MLRLYRPHDDPLRWGLWTMGAVGLLLLGSLGARTLSPRKIAVIATTEARAHAGTSRDTVVRFELHSGTELRWLESRDDWYRIELPDGTQGWMHTDDLVALRL